MSFYDQVPVLADGADTVPVALEELGPTATVSYDFVPPENVDVISVHSEPIDDGFDSDDEVIVQEKTDENVEKSVDTVDGGRPAFGDVVVPVEPLEDKPKENGNRYVINDDDTKPRGRCFWFFVIAITFAVILFLGFLTFIVVVYTQLVSSAPLSGNSTVSTSNTSTNGRCGRPADLKNGTFTPSLDNYSEYSTVTYMCNNGNENFTVGNITCFNGKWETFTWNCTEIESDTTESATTVIQPTTASSTTVTESTSIVTSQSTPPETTANDVTNIYVTTDDVTTNNVISPQTG